MHRTVKSITFIVMKFLITITFLYFGLSSYGQHTNVMINISGDPNEPSILVNTKNTNNIVAGSNLNHVYHSFDGGLTWSKAILTSSYSVWGDPCIINDTSGNVYYFHLSNPPSGSWIDRIVAQKSTDGGVTWSNGTYTGLNGTKDQDKEWVAIDQNTNAIYVTWTQFDVYGSSASTDSSHIMFSRSMDGGLTWSPAIRINKKGGDCIDEDNTVEGATPAVGPNGEIYVSWVGADGIVFDRSLDTGNTWLANEIPVTTVPGGWDYSIPGIMRANGLPITACDLSGGPNHGTIYINWSDQRNGTNDTDVWLVKSTDGGNTWTSPTRVNDDPAGKHQFFTWMTIDQVTGYLYFVFYDRRNYTNENTDVYMAISRDGGNTFTNFKISDAPFYPNSGVFFGDYTNVSTHNNVVRPIWGRMDASTMSIWTAIVDLSAALGEEEIDLTTHFDLDQNFPNPMIEETYISFKLRNDEKVSLKLYDNLGNLKATLIESAYYTKGKHKIKIDAAALKLSEGLYYYRIITSSGVKSKSMMVKH